MVGWLLKLGYVLFVVLKNRTDYIIWHLPASTPLHNSIHLWRSSGKASNSANLAPSEANALSFSNFFCLFHRSKNPCERRHVSFMSKSSRIVSGPWALKLINH